MTNHKKEIEAIITACVNSKEFSGVVIQGPNGWGKTVTAQTVLTSMKTDFAKLSGRSTVRGFFDFLGNHPAKIILVDDTSGVLNSPDGLALLKQATELSSTNRVRQVTWTKNESHEVVRFTGRLVIVCNVFPTNPDARAVMSRCIPYPFLVSVEDAKPLLREAAEDTKWFKKTRLAREVAEFLIGELNEKTLPEINYRTFQRGYTLAGSCEHWKPLLLKTMRVPLKDPHEVVRNLADSGGSVGEQEAKFKEATGLKRRRFQAIREELGFARKYLRRH